MKTKLLLLAILYTSIIHSQCWTTAVGGQNYTLAIREDGTLWSWGGNDFGQLGNGTTTNSNIPVQVGTDTDYVSIAASSHSVVLKSNGTIWAWGKNHFGQLGNGTTTDSNTPAQVGTDTDWAQISVGTASTFAIKEDGTLWGWGDNYFAQIDSNISDYSIETPMQIGTDNDWEYVSVGSSHIVALKQGGTIWCWGNNYSGQCGISVSEDRIETPTQVGNDTDWRAIQAGLMHTLAIKDNNTLWSWGSNLYGQLGLDTNSNPYFPAQIGNETTWSSISGTFHTCFAKKEDNSIWGWGLNVYNQLGNGSVENVNEPTLVNLENVEDIYPGFVHTIGIKEDISFWTWGKNENGQLGDGTLEDRPLPVQIECTALISSINDNERTQALLYPNPVENTLYIVSDLPITQVTITDCTGKTLLTQKNYTVDLKNLSTGIYYVLIEGDGVQTRKKILKK